MIKTIDAVIGSGNADVSIIIIKQSNDACSARLLAALRLCFAALPSRALRCGGLLWARRRRWRPRMHGSDPGLPILTLCAAAEPAIQRRCGRKSRGFRRGARRRAHDTHTGAHAGHVPRRLRACTRALHRCGAAPQAHAAAARVGSLGRREPCGAGRRCCRGGCDRRAGSCPRVCALASLAPQLSWQASPRARLRRRGTRLLPFHRALPLPAQHHGGDATL